MNDCIFCQIVDCSLPSKKVFEDEHTLAFMDVAGDVDGHILVIPKKHVKDILDCSGEELSHLMETVKKVSLHLIEKCGYNGGNLLNASDESAGQSVPHFHIHIIPRKKGDNIDAWPHFDGAKQKKEDVFSKITMI